jgi:FKBP-type peptidyl-prolyl cis-trans isomerase
LNKFSEKSLFDSRQKVSIERLKNQKQQRVDIALCVPTQEEKKKNSGIINPPVHHGTTSFTIRNKKGPHSPAQAAAQTKPSSKGYTRQAGTKMGFEKQILRAGTGPMPVKGRKVTVHCTGYGSPLPSFIP